MENEDLFSFDFTEAIKASLSGSGVRAENNTDSERAYLKVPAPNVIQWVIAREYLNSPSLYEYTRCYQVIRDVFQLRCPNCNPQDPSAIDCWNKSKDYLESECLLEWSSDHEDDVCPKCRHTRTDFIVDGKFQRINQMHLVCGQRAGKSITAALAGTFVEHRLITIGLSHPGGLRGYLGLTVSDPIEMGFLASNETQSKDTIWAKFLAFRRDSPWFRRFVPWVKDQQRLQAMPEGMKRWEYEESNQKILNEHPDIFIILKSQNSNSSGLRGCTRIFGGLDEIAFMMDGDSRISADEIYRAVNNSLVTVRSRAKLHNRPPWLGLLCSVSSPRHKDDKAMRLLRTAPQTEGMVAYHYATWEFNPYEPRANFDDEYAKDPVGAERDFGARPPLTSHPLIQDVSRWRTSVISTGLSPTALFNYDLFQQDGRDYVGVEVQTAWLQTNGARFVAFDAGKSFDAFAGACAHAEILVDEVTGAQRVITVFDWVIRILPAVGTEVYYESVFNVLQALRQKHNIIRCEFDRWNATHLIQQVRRLGVHCEEVNNKNEDYIRFRADAFNGLVKMLPPSAEDMNEAGEWIIDPPYMSAESCALYEIEVLEEDPETRKVFNPRKGEQRGWNSNDVAEVIVHAHKMVQESGYTKREGTNSKDDVRKRSEADSVRYSTAKQGGVFSPGRFMLGKGTRSGRGW